MEVIDNAVELDDEIIARYDGVGHESSEEVVFLILMTLPQPIKFRNSHYQLLLKNF